MPINNSVTAHCLEIGRGILDEIPCYQGYFQKLTKNSIGSLKLNDDVFFYKTKKLIVSVDTYNEGVHFLNFKYPHLVIKKILRSSISDLICKGINPKFYFISAAGNENSFTKKNLILISKSLRQEQKKYNIILAGGDTTYSKKISFNYYHMIWNIGQNIIIYTCLYYDIHKIVYYIYICTLLYYI